MWHTFCKPLTSIEWWLCIIHLSVFSWILNEGLPMLNYIATEQLSTPLSLKPGGERKKDKEGNEQIRGECPPNNLRSSFTKFSLPYFAGTICLNADERMKSMAFRKKERFKIIHSNSRLHHKIGSILTSIFDTHDPSCLTKAPICPQLP